MIIIQAFKIDGVDIRGQDVLADLKMAAKV
ncbi:MAG: hypothetical protein DID90_2727553283 [Candidatus Nitrotoga sp. LAW]|nr:MAG: hypothetical protein DID90_2727553283 [Candidatus Nitrotoga sp. LAW]